MKNLEPKVYRQRLVIEGHHNIDADGNTIKEFLNTLSNVLQMRIFAGPYSWPPDKWDNQDVELYGLNGFVAWTESGCHVYAWRECRFFTVDIYSCKQFDNREVVKFIKRFWNSKDAVYASMH